MKTYVFSEIMNNLKNNDQSNDWLRMFDLCQTHVAESGRGNRKLRIYNAEWNEIAMSSDPAFTRLRVDVLDDGSMISCHLGHVGTLEKDMRILRNAFDPKI